MSRSSRSPRTVRFASTMPTRPYSVAIRATSTKPLRGAFVYVSVQLSLLQGTKLSTFQEATENTMTCEGDDPDQFEFLLKFMYTEDYDMDAIKKLAAGNTTRRVAFPIELHAIADKYDVCHLLEATLHDVADLLQYEDSLDMLRALISVHYKSVSIADSAIGNILTTKLLTQHRTFASTDEFTDLVKSQPVFCLDAVFHMGRQKSHACDYCGHVSFPNFSAPLVKITKYVFCENCGNK